VVRKVREGELKGSCGIKFLESLGKGPGWWGSIGGKMKGRAWEESKMTAFNSVSFDKATQSLKQRLS